MTDKIRIVLVEPSHPGNIGGAARAMKTMGLSDLALVRPVCYPDPEADARAAGADDILRSARVCGSLPEALADCHLAIGTTARRRSLNWPMFDSRASAAEVARLPDNQRAAVVFGRERTGLTNDELAHCRWGVRIPANPDYGSLNLAAAVQILAYELRWARLGPEATTSAAPPAHPPASVEEMEHFYDHLEEVMGQTGFLKENNRRTVMRRMRRLFHRAGPDQNELNILRGMLSSLQGVRSRPKN